MKPFIAFLIACLAATAAGAQGLAAWRTAANSLVGAANRAYVRSDRPAMLEAMHALRRHLMATPQEAPTMADRLTYRADLLKLRADSVYDLIALADAPAPLAAEADSLWREALAIYAAHPALNQAHAATVVHEELAQLYYLLRRYDDALREMDAVVADFEERIALGEIEADDPLGPEPYDEYLRQLSARAMCRARCGRTAEALADLDRAIARLSPANATVRAELLRRRAKVLMLGAGSRPDASTLREATATYARSFAALREWCIGRLAEADEEERESFWLHARPLLSDAYRTEGAAPSLMYNLTLFVKGLLLEVATAKGDTARLGRTLRATWHDVQRHLHTGEVAVEFVSYEAADTTRMAALVLHPEGSPEWVPMPLPAEVTGHRFEAFGDDVLERITSTARSRKDGLYADTALHRLAWPDALRRAIGTARTVLFAPDAFQHRLAIEYLWPAPDAPQLYRLTSTRRLLSRSADGGHLPAGGALVLGDVDYDAAQAQQPSANDPSAYARYAEAHVRFPLLRHSGAETDSIIAVRRCAADTLLQGAAATEAAFRRLAPRYGVVFLSTHGDFNAAALPQGTDLKPCLTDRSLSENVVALAGVNTSLSAAAFDAGHTTDGLLSALELARLPLQGVRLFAISACQTGLGFITSEGVYGLQRGLKLGGAGALMLSLWSVHDEATAELMARFHAALATGRTLHEALMEARAAMAGTDDDFALYDTPQYTDAFILIDALP